MEQKSFYRMITLASILSFALIMILFQAYLNSYKIVEAPEDLRIKAGNNSWKLLGSFSSSERINSGLNYFDIIEKTYIPEIEGTKYSLKKFDNNIDSFLAECVTPIEAPTKGDIVLLGMQMIKNVGIVDKFENNRIYFITGYTSSGLIEYQEYSVNDENFKGFARMLFVKKP